MSAETLSKLAHQQQLELESPVRGPSYPFLFGNDVDSVDVATRVAMVKFFHSPNLFGDFGRDIRTLRLYPRPIVTIQLQPLLNSRQKLSPFMSALVGTQAVECYAEWSLAPHNQAFKHILNGVFDPIQIGDKPRWFAHRLQLIQHRLCQDNDPILKLLILNDSSLADTEDLSEESEPSRSSSSISFTSEVEDEGMVEGSTPMSTEDGAEKEMSFPSDVSVAGSDAAIETGSDKSTTFAPSPLSSANGVASQPPSMTGIKPPTPTVTPRCSSPLSSLPILPGKRQDEVRSKPNVDDISAQELFFNIEQLTQQAKESFDLSRVPNIKSAVNRERLSNVGKSVVENFAASKKLEFFKALTGSTPPPMPTAQSTNSNVVPLESHPVKEDVSSNHKDNHVVKENISCNYREDHRGPAKLSTPTAQTPKEELYSSRPMSPKYDIAFPRSNLSEIALPRPSSRIPRKELNLKSEKPHLPSAALKCEETPETPSPPPPSHPPPPLPNIDPTPPPLPPKSFPSLPTITHQPPSLPTTIVSSADYPSFSACSLPTEPDIDSPSNGLHRKQVPSGPSPVPCKTIETATTRFLAEHHPQLTRSNSTLSNASSYSQTTQDIFSSISSDLSGLATQTSSLLESMFGYTSGANYNNGGRRNREVDSVQGTSAKYAAAVSGDITNMIKDTVDRVLMGEGIGWLKLNRLKKLMQEEMHRSLMLNYLQRKFGQHLTRDGHIEDLCLGKPVWKGVLRLLTAVIHGLESSFTYGYGANSTQTGLASAFQLLELIHTHYWSPVETMGISHATSPIITDINGLTSKRLLNRLHPDLERVGSNDSGGSSTLHDNAFETESESGSLTETGSMVASSQAMFHSGANVPLEARSASIAGATRRSVVSEGEIDHLATSASLYEAMVKHLPKKSVISGRYRFRCGSLDPITTEDFQWTEKSYLFEGLIPLTQIPVKTIPNGNASSSGVVSERRSSNAPSSVGINHPSFLWQDMQFWEDLFCDTVAQERRLIGMDSGAEELLERYKALAENEKRILENDEDRLLSVILYNLAAFMLLMQVNESL